jgi:hypothetical protein
MAVASVESSEGTVVERGEVVTTGVGGYCSGLELDVWRQALELAVKLFGDEGVERSRSLRRMNGPRVWMGDFKGLSKPHDIPGSICPKLLSWELPERFRSGWKAPRNGGG